ncbi:MAG: type I-U CRISPR-associated helicase/endonuclease Cas3, partial [Chloroflexota bacterium]
MIPGVGDFGAFFAAMNGGLRPFAWQSRLLRGLLEEGRWPDRIAAPTGSGKSAVIDVHVFAVALMAAGVGPRIPRRLSIVVDRRAIVDSHVDRAERVNARLRDAASRGDGVVGAVAHALLGLYVGDADERDPVVVSVVRGGALPDTKWRDEPTACAVICATPDMWGSRLLLRGYGTSRLARPREAGLLAYDAVVVVDEAHLNRQALRTGRRIADLESMAARRVGPPVLQVVEMTATPHLTETDDGASGPEGVVSVEPDDLASDPDLAVRVERPKPVSIVPIPDWPPRTTKSVGTLALVVADEAERLRSEHGQTVGCVLNTVAAAVSVAEILRARGLEIEVLVGRMRPWDIIALRERRPHLLTPKGDPGVDVLVATQTIEVGVDADFSALVTELASGSALAQRAGRVNRLGRRTAGPVVVVGPPDDGMRLRDAPPYISADLEAGLAWLVGRTADPGGLAPWALRSDPPPPQTLHRTLLARPEPSDAWFLARTTDGLFAEPDLDLWLADDLDVDHDIGLVVRQGLPEDVAVAVSLLRATPPRPKEVFPVPIRLATTVLDAHADEPAYLFREGDVTPLGPGAGLRPGDLIVVDDGRRCFRERVVDEGGTGAADDV